MVAIVAIAIGIGVTAGTASASAATPSHKIQTAHHASVPAHRATSGTMDWWWF
ncbi:MAG TPA: hypothetical protein VFE19_04585 [Jatrophihabitantaceae bacterium]|nr:hypothetical protein [Jatrophihabitantaceae bacterium]